MKLYKNLKVVSCKKCDFSRREKIDIKKETETEVSEINEIDILNKLDEQNEK